MVAHRTYPSEADHRSFQECRHEAQIADLEALARKRFWTLEPENQTRSRFLVKDQLGRILYGPEFLPSLRGFFEAQPPQA